MTLFWDRNGEPIEDTIEWAKRFEDAEYRMVAVDQDDPGSPMVSTIWQGLDLAHSIIPGAIPMIFETAYLEADEHGAGGVVDRWFSATEEDALMMHRMTCIDKLGREPVPNGGLKNEIIARERGRE